MVKEIIKVNMKSKVVDENASNKEERRERESKTESVRETRTERGKKRESK